MFTSYPVPSSRSSLFISMMMMMMIIMITIPEVRSQRTPTISYITQEQIKNIGESVEFSCSVLYADDYPVLWSKTDKLKSTESILISTGAARIIPDTRFHVVYQRDNSTYTLSVSDIQETDAGIYRCHILIGSQLSPAEVELKVRRPPLIFDNSTRSLVVTEGQFAKLECYAEGFPPPTVWWRKQNSEVLPTGSAVYRGNVMNITAVNKEDRGTYYCVAENGVGKGSRRNVAVEVQFAPIVTATRKRVGQAFLYDMDLECRVEAYPPPAILWLKDGVILANNQHFEISHFTTTDEITFTMIRIITIEKRQFGDYTCKAFNIFGSSEAKIELFETIIPMCPPACGGSNPSG